MMVNHMYFILPHQWGFGNVNETWASAETKEWEKWGGRKKMMIAGDGKNSVRVKLRLANRKDLSWNGPTRFVVEHVVIS